MEISKHKTAFIVLEGYLSEKEFTELTLKVNEVCRKPGIDKVIFDTSKIEILKKNEIEVFKENITPIFNQSEMKKVAYIKPENAFGELSMNMVMQSSNSQKINRFLNLEEAEKWVYNN